MTEKTNASDRELLEPAAKAAGIELSQFELEDGTFEGAYRTKDGYWNPLTDDGDALRLAVTLDMDLWLGCGVSSAVNGTNQGPAEFAEQQRGDKFAATRRAIVRAAAAIGAAK